MTYSLRVIGLWMLLLIPALAIAAVNAPTDLEVAPRYDGTISLVVEWTDASPDEEGFEVQRRPVAGAYVTIASPAAGTEQFVDAGAGAAQSWEYRVRALNSTEGDSAWLGPSVAMSPVQVWPMNDGSRNILDNYGMPLLSVVAGNGFYFHKGVDISGSGVQVNAGRGGVVDTISNGAGGTLWLTVDYGAADDYRDVYSHITVDAVLALGDVVPTGTKVGTVRNDYFNRDPVADHVHWGTRDNLSPFVAAANRDPGGTAPVVADANNDGKDLIVVDANNNDHNNPREPAWGDVDILVDAYDDLSPGNTLEQGLFNISYWIQAGPPEGLNVRGPADPYKLIEFSPSGYTPGGPAPTGAVENAVIYWDLEADLQGVDTWKSYLTWIITNTKGNDGTGANADASQFWRTDARAGTGVEPNGSDSMRAREVQEASFPDGAYFIHILPSDHVRTADHVRRVDVDNSRPYVKRVTVLSGLRIVYHARWAWDGGTAQLALQPSTFDNAAAFTALRTQDVAVEVEFSEPMATASLGPIASLGVTPTLASTQAAHARTVWRGLISNLDIDDGGADDGTHMLTINGSDIAGNALLQINDRNPMGADHHNRNGAGVLQGTVGTDTIHGFRIGPLSGTIPVTAIFMKQTTADPATTPANKSLLIQQALNNYFDEVSYSEISFAVTGTGWYQLNQPLDWYYTSLQTPLIDLVQEAITTAEANGTPVSDSDYVLVVTDEVVARDEWSTNGAWPYDVTTAPGWKLFASGTLNLASPNPRITNLMGRIVGLIDLFAYPEVIVARPFVGPWSHMSDKDTDVHVLAWEKWRAGWLDETGTATGNMLTRVPKPPVATPIVDQMHTISRLDNDDDTTKMVAVEIGDRLHYTIEYRQQQNLDSSLPDEGVLIVKSNDYVNQGEGPGIVQESLVTPGDVVDAPFNLTAPRDVFDDVGSGVNVAVTSMDANQAQIRLNYQVPPTENDVFVSPHERWKAEDIWIDAPDISGNFEADPLAVKDAAEQPVIGELNKVYGRIRNQGSADATNFEVHLEIREPWGAGGPWRSLNVDTVPLLQGQGTNPNDRYLIVGDWTPVGDIHSCVKLTVLGVANDGNVENNWTQENVSQFVSTPGSPYDPITSRFGVENPYAEEIVVFFKTDGMPHTWSYIFSPERLVIPANGVGEAQITVQPHESAPLCTEEVITVDAYTPRVDTLKQLGGITLNVALKSPASLTIESFERCRAPDKKLNQNLASRDQTVSHCAIYTQGCTDPGLPNTQVAIVYTAPDGTKQVRYVTTDANGCYFDVMSSPAPGLWQTQVVLEEQDCRSGAKTLNVPVDVEIRGPFNSPPTCTLIYLLFVVAIAIAVIALVAMIMGSTSPRSRYLLTVSSILALFLAYYLARICGFGLLWLLVAVAIALLIAAIVICSRRTLMAIRA